MSFAGIRLVKDDSYMKKQAGSSPAVRNMTVSAMLFAVSLVLSALESVLPPIPVPVPGIRLGLSNIPVMYALFFSKKRQAFAIGVLKAVFVGITRGVTAGLLSFSGGMLSLAAMTLLIMIFRGRISYTVLSIFGAVFHNIGQLTAVSLLYTTIYIWVYLPVLFLFGTAAGIVTAVLLKFVLPALKKLDLK